jgi:hypothetical protein
LQGVAVAHNEGEVFARDEIVAGVKLEVAHQASGLV